MYKLLVMKNIYFIYNQFAREAIERCVNITDGRHWFVGVYFCESSPHTHLPVEGPVTRISQVN